MIRHALITGAASGIGAAFARRLAGTAFVRRLAGAGHGLVLVDRRRDRLDALAEELHQRHQTAVEVVHADLTTHEGLRTVEDVIARLDTLELVVNSAGFGTGAPFALTDLPRQVAMVELNVIATLRLTRAALPGMIARRRGMVVNVSSLAAWVPAAGSAVYSGTKAFVSNFTESLAVELRGSGVQVQVLCPGYTRTEFHAGDDFREFRARTPGFLWMTPEQVAAASLRALDRGGPLACIPGALNRCIAFLSWLPGIRGIVRAVSGRLKNQGPGPQPR